VSDIFAQIRRDAASPQAETDATRIFDRIRADAAAVGQQREENLKKFSYTLPVADWEYGIINRAMQVSPDPEGTAHTWATAVSYSRYFDKPLDEVIRNLDSYNQFWLGRKFTAPKDNWQAINDSFRIGPLQLRQMELATQWQDSGGKDEGLKKQLDEIQGQIDSLSDSAPRPFLTEALKYVGQSGPFMLQSGAAAAASGAAIGGAATLAIAGSTGTVASGGLLGPAAAAAIVGGFTAAGAAAGSFTEMLKLTRGLEYYRMRQKGIRDDIAQPLAWSSGIFQSYLETALGNIPGALSKLGGVPIETISAKVMQRLAVSGKWGASLQALAGYMTENLEEGITEGVQQLTSAGADALGAVLQGYGVEKDSAAKVAEDVWQNAKGGFMASMLLGIPGNIIEYKGNANEAKRLKFLAGETTLDQFIARGRESPLVESLPEKQKTEALTTIYQAQQAQMKAREAALEPKPAPGAEGATAVQAAIERVQGKLYTEKPAVVETNQDGSTKEILRAGNPKTGDFYGRVVYARAEDGSIEVDSVEGRKDLRPEILRSLIEKNPGVAIEWNPTSSENRAIRDQLVAENPRGPEAGLAWFASDEPVKEQLTRNEFVRQIRDSIADPEIGAKAEGLLAFADAMAKANGESTDSMLGTLFERQAITKTGALGNGQADAGIVFQDRAGTALAPGSISRDSLGQVKALIKVTEGTDFTALVHEFFHAAERLYLRGDQVAAFEEALGKARADWQREDLEFLADHFETYLKDGNAPTPELAGVFQRLAEALARYVEEFKRIAARHGSRYQLTPELRSAYDSMVQNSEALKTARQGVEKSKVEESNNRGSESKAQPQGAVKEEGYYALRSRFERDGAKMGRQEAILTQIQLYKAQIEHGKAGNPAFSTKGIEEEIRKLEADQGKTEPMEIFHSADPVDSKDSVSLVVLHNIDADQIPKIDEFGGLPMPSIAITRPDIDFTQFGDSTLIADPKVAREALEQKRLYDRDIWSPTVPEPDWKINRKKLDDFDSRWRKAGKKTGDYVGIETMMRSDIERGAEYLAQKIKSYVATMYLFLDEHGQAPEVVMKPKEPDFNLPLGAAIEVKKYLEAHPGDGGDYYRERFNGAAEVIRKYAKVYAKENGVARLAKDLAERWTGGNSVYSLMRFAKEYSPTDLEIDKSKTREAVEGAIELRKDEYERWIHDTLAPAYSDPTIKVGGRKVPFNAESVLAWMQGQGLRGTEKTMTYGPSKAASMAGRPFHSREQIRDDEANLVSQKGSQAFYDEKVEPLNKKVQEGLPKHYKYDDTWEALDSIYMAIGKYLRENNNRSPERMRKQLSAAGFTKVPSDLVDTAVDLALALAFRPQDYYEAKPGRIVGLSEFRAAVIPSSTSQATKEAIAAKGLAMYEYSTPEDRPNVVRSALAEMNDILFHTRESLTSEALKYESGQKFAEDMMLFDVDSIDEGTVPDLPRAERSDWYRKFYEEAHAAIEAAPVDAAEADRAFLNELAANGYSGLKSLLVSIGQEKKKAKRGTAVVNSIIDALGLRALKGSRVDISESALKGAMTQIRGDVRNIRHLAAGLWQDEAMIRQVQAESDGAVATDEAKAIKDPLPTPKTPSKTELQAAAARVKNKTTAEKISELRHTEKELTEETARLKEEVKLGDEVIGGLEKELAKYSSVFTTQERAIAGKYQAWKQADKSAKKAAAEVRKLERSGAKVPQAKRDAVIALKASAAGLKAEVRSLTRTAPQGSMLPAYFVKLDAVALERAHRRELEAERRALVAERDYKLSLGRSISRKPGGLVHIDYAEAIREIQAMVDPNFRRQSTIDARKKSALYFHEHPDIAALLKPATLELINSKPLNEWTVAELEDLARQVQNLRIQGRTKRRLQIAGEKKLRAGFKAEVQDAVLRGEPLKKAVGQAYQSRVITKADLEALKPDRIVQLLDGKEDGPNKKLLQDLVNSTWNAKMRGVDRRQGRITSLMKELEITAGPIHGPGWIDVNSKMDIGGFTGTDGWKPTVQDVMYWAIGYWNERNQKALIEGNGIPAMVIEKGIEQLDPRAKKLANAIAADYRENFPRLRQAYRAMYNIDLPGEISYVPMRRQDITFETRSEEIAADLMVREGVAKAAVPKGMTKVRVDIGSDFQAPVRTDLVNLFMDSVQKEEAFIHQDQVIRRLNSVYGDMRVKRAIQQKFGTDAVKWVQKYIGDLARPDAHRVSTGASKLVNAARSTIATAALSYNVVSYAVQAVTSWMPFLGDAGPIHIAAAAMKALAHLPTFLREIEEKSPLVKNRDMKAGVEMLKRLDGNAYERVIKQMGQWGMAPFGVIDKVSCAIGWQAVYDKAIAEGKTEAEARTAGDAAVVRGQPSGRVQDLAQLYRSDNDLVNLAVMFTNPLNSFYNMIRWDIPHEMKQGHALRALGDAVAIAMTGIAYSALHQGLPAPDDDEETRRLKWLKVFGAQFTDAIPVFGGMVSNLVFGGYAKGSLNLFPFWQEVLTTKKNLSNEEWGKALGSALLAYAQASGLPAVEIKRIMRAIESGDLEWLAGWKPE